MWGNRDSFDPWTYVEQRHPDVQVVVMRLRDRVQGCVDVDRRVIWLDDRLSPLQAKCTLAYQIGQFEMGPLPACPRQARATQKAAEEWAAMMLVPSEVFALAWAGCLDLQAMAAFCDVDLPTFRARIRAASDADQDAAVEGIAATRLSA